jgi:hypothetical protein
VLATGKQEADASAAVVNGEHALRSGRKRGARFGFMTGSGLGI